MNNGISNHCIAVLLKAVLLICSALTASVSHAEYFGSPTGRTATFSSQPQLAVEATFSNGEFAGVDYQQMGLRLNYQYSPKIMVFGDLGQSELSSESETSFGLGAYYSLGQSILGSDDSAVKVSLHQVSFDTISGVTGGGVSVETVCRPDDPITLPGILDDDLGLNPLLCLPEVTSTSGTSFSRGGAIRNIAIELLISGAMSGSILGDNANWYANGGIQLLNGAIEDDTVLGIGIGVVLPMTESEIFAGLDYADDTYVGLGYRYFVQ